MIDRLTRIEQRLDTIEAELDQVDSEVEELKSRITKDIPVPNRTKAELEANILQLEQKRAALLISIKPQHPTIRDIDRQLRILRRQVSMVE